MSQEGGISTSREPHGESVSDRLKLDSTSNLSGLSEGVQTAYVFTADAWRADAEKVLHKLAHSGDVFTVDDLRRSGVHDPDKPQRWGSLFAIMRRRGTIELAGLELHKIAAGEVQAIRQWRGSASARRRSA